MSGPLRNPRHERLAQELATGKTQVEALGLAGLKRSGASGRVLVSDGLKARVAELLSGGAERAEITVQGQIEKAERLLNKAEELDQISAAVSALTLQSRLAGFLHDKPAAPAGDTYNIAFIKAPPQETFEQFNERRTRQLRLVGTAARSTNGSGRSNLVS